MGIKLTDLQPFCLDADEARARSRMGASCSRWARLSAPFSFGAFTYATDGSVVVRVASNPAAPVVEETPVRVDRLNFDHDTFDTWEPVPRPAVRETEKCKHCKGTGFEPDVCPECGGDGSLEFASDLNSYEVDCITCEGFGTHGKSDENCGLCDGTGKTEKHVKVPIFRRLSVSNIYLMKINRLPGAEFGVQRSQLYLKQKRLEPDAAGGNLLVDRDQILRFRFAGGVGLLMGMKQ